MAFGGGSSGGPNADINVTPLVDVVLVLLIIFMVVTPLLQVNMPADIPKPDDSPPTDQRPNPDQVIVQLKSDGTVFVNTDQLPTDWEPALTERIKKAMAGRPAKEKIAFLSGSENRAFGEVVHIMDVCRGAGVERVGIIDPI